MKNLTQLPWSGKGSKAKNDNTLGRMRGGIRSRIGSMSLKDTSLFGVILALLLTLGVGEMKANSYWYAGNAKSWSTTDYPMTVSNDGYYEYIQVTYNGGHEYKIITTKGSWDNALDYNQQTPGFNNTNITNMNSASNSWSCSNAKIWTDEETTYYVLVYYPSTTINSTANPKVCASTFLPDNRSLIVYFANTNDWGGTIKAYAWYNNGGHNSAAWPGSTMTNTGKTYNGHAIYTYTFTESYPGGLFNNKSGDSGNQTTDITFGYSANGKMYNGSSMVALQYDVTLDQQSGSGGTSSIIAICGSAMPGSKTAPTRTGYTFGGYFTGKNGSGTQYYTSSMTSARNWPANGSGPTTLYAKWTEITHDVKISATTSPASAGTSPSPSSWTAFGEVTGGNISITANTGYTFSSWTILTGGAGTFGDAASASTKFYPTKDSELRANFTANTYTITLNGNEGTGGTATVQYNANALSSITDASRAGYSLNGYYTAASGGSKVINANGSLNNVIGWVSGGYWIKASNATLYAQWTENATYYTVTYGVHSSGNGSLSAGISSGASVVSGTSVTFSASPNTGYEVDGYFSNAECTSPIAGAGYANTYTTTISGNTTVYVKFKKKTCVITLNKNGGSTGAGSTTATYGNALNSFTTHTRAGYTLTGYWTASSGGTKIINANGTLVASTTYANASSQWIGSPSTLTLYAQWTENKVTLTPTVSYDAGTSTYTATSANTVGVATTTVLTASAPNAAHYTFAGWTLTNLTVTSGDAATDRSITVKITTPGSAIAAVANYEEVLTQSSWVIKGGTAISGSNWATDVAMSKTSGASTSDIVYATINISATNTGASNGDYKFKVVKKSPDTYFGLTADGQYYLMRGESGTEKTLATGNQDIELRADVTGDYVFKVDYSNPSSPKLTVTWPTAVYLNSDNESAYADGSVTLTAEGANLVSGSKTIEYEFFKGNNTDPANKIGSTQTFNSVTATSHSTTQSVSPEFSTSDYGASQVYTVKMTVNGGTPYTNTITIYRKWDIYVHDVVGWGGLRLYMWGGTTGDNSWPGTACSVLSGNWYTVTLSSKYYSGFLLNKSSDDNIKTNDHHTSAAAAGDKNDHDELCSYFEEGSYYYIHSYEWESKTYYELNPLDMSAPTVEMQDGALQSKAINTTELYLTGLVTDYGGDGLNARDMAECGFIINGTEYPVSSSCTAEDSGFFWGYVGGLTPGTTYTVSAYAKNIMGRGVSTNTASVATRAAGTNTIKVRTGVSDPVPYIYAWTWNEVCDHSTLQNAAWPGVAMTLSITGTTYKWYTYELSNEYNEFKISESGSNETNNFNNPFESTCYWYHSSEATQGDRMGSMTCPYVTPQLMIEENAGEEDFTYLEMSTSPTISKTVSLAAKSTYLFKIVYNAEWYGKASVNLSRAENSVSGISAAIEDNMAITTDAAGDYTFTFSTPGIVTVTYPTAYTVTFGYGTGGSAVTASATTAGGALTSGDYVAAGDEVTFTQTPVTGYTFKGWYTTADGNTTVGTMGVSDNELNDIAADATVYAQYTPNEYTVTFDATTNGGTCGTASKSVTFDAAYGDLPEATKAAKVFAGWYTTASGAGTQVTAETIVSNAANHTIYARFEDTYSVTIQYKSGDVTLKPNGSTTASETALAPEITAPEFLGYTFTGWTGTSATFADASSATTTVNVTAATTITANYSAIPTVYFKNNLGWEHVYVTFDCNWVTAGGATVPSNNTKPYFEMTQLGTSDIFSCRIPDAYVTSSYAGWKGNIAFDNLGFAATSNVGSNTAFNDGEFLGRGDFDPSATMFIPYDGDSETRNGGTYYRTGCWMKYNSTDPGYKLYANTYREGSGGSAVTGTPVLLEAGIAGGFEFKATVSLGKANYTYGIMLHKEYTKNSNAIWYTNTGTIYASTTTLPWDFTTDGASENGTRCGLHTEATGNYEITVSFATGKPMVNVTYPVSTGDWRLVYKDRATWSNGAHSAAWQHPSRVIKAKADAEDIVSFYVSKAVGANATVELQKCTAIDPGTGAQTWVKQSDVDLSEITSTGIYNFKVTQNGSMEATVAFDGGYVGNFYIRTDASDGGWSNYKTSGTNTMTYSEYSLDHGGDFGPYSHYFMRYVTAGSNIKFCIANDYSECISDTIVGDTYTGEYIAASGNVRFMWYWETNKIGRAYISGSSIISDRFLVLEGDAKMFNEAGTALTTGNGRVAGLNEYEMNFTDDQNWIYEATVQAQPEARFKLTAKYNNKVQYFYGDEDATEQLLGGNGESTTKYTIRIVYDFKTNRLIKAFIPSGTITENLSIEADLMIIREHQEDAQQINFTGSGALSDVKTVYGAMKFNKWTVNGKEKTGGHATTSDSRYKRDLFYISFPFDVKLSDVFGFGTYGKHWIIEYYDGKGRAKNGFWADSDSYWKFVLPSQRSSFTLKAFEGYILALDLDEMTEGSSIWNNDVQDVYVYFPSSAAVEDIQATNRLITIDQEGYQCQIGPRFEGGEDRRVKDSYWHVIGVPSFANYNNPLTETNGGTAIDWSDDDGKIWETPSLPYLYEWNSADNSLTVTTSATFNFKATYSYMVQYAGTSIYWSAVNATPSSVVARKNDNQPTSAEFRLELLQGEEKADQTFVRLTDEENVTTGFDFNYDLSKEMNANKANIFTMITTAMSDGNTVTESAANCLPMSGQTTVVPVGVKIAADGDYTFAIPEGTEGVGVTLIDQETGIRTSLSALAYTVTLEAGTYDERFVLEISPIHNVPTEQSAVSDQQSDVRKVLIDGLLYIVRDNKMYDARGAMIMEK